MVDDDYGNTFANPDIDIVLVDIVMPMMDGYDTVRAMRRLPWAGPLAVVALTARTGTGERERCIEAGASAYVSGPVANGPAFLLDLGESVTDREPVGSVSDGLR